MTSLTWLPDAAWRGALLLAIAFIVARLFKAQPAAVRHVLWTGALAGVMAMPILAVVAPVRVPVAIPQRVAELSSRVPAGSPLGEENRLKLVTECKASPAHQQYVRLVRQAYPVLNRLTGPSRRTPRVNVTY